MDKKKIELVSAFMGLEGKLTIISTIYGNDGSVTFNGYKEVNGENEKSKIILDKYQVELINNANSVIEIYETYSEMQFFYVAYLIKSVDGDSYYFYEKLPKEGLITEELGCKVYEAITKNVTHKDIFNLYRDWEVVD